MIAPARAERLPASKVLHLLETAVWAAADLNGDGADDLIGAFGSTHDTKPAFLSGVVVQGRLRRRFMVDRRLLLPPDEPGATCIALGDYDNDGFKEAIVSNTRRMFGYHWKQGWVRFINLGPGPRMSVACSLQTLSVFPQGNILVADVDRDGNNEVILAAMRDGLPLEVEQWHPEEKRLIIEWSVSARPETFTGLAVADADNDGDLEIVGVYGTFHRSGLRVYEWDSKAGYTLAAEFPLPGVTPSVAVGDCDNDGDNEILVGCTHRRRRGETRHTPLHLFKYDKTTGSYKQMTFNDLTDAHDIVVGDFFGTGENLTFMCRFGRTTGMCEMLICKWEPSAGRLIPIYRRDTLLGTVRPILADTDGDGGKELILACGSALIAPVWEEVPELAGLFGGAGDSTATVDLAAATLGPDPLGPRQIEFSVPPGVSNSIVRIYDSAGQLVRTLLDGPAGPGRQVVLWNGLRKDGSRVSPGTYFAQIRFDGKLAESRPITISP